MPIKLVTPKSEIDAYIEHYRDNAQQAIIKTFSYVGESCIREARVNGSYMNQTGNLRSSIGYAVVVDGQIVKTKVSAQVMNGVDGKSAATSFLARLSSEYPSGIYLIVVAGMNYASYVEGRGKNVLTSAELLAERLVPQLLEQIGFKVKR